MKMHWQGVQKVKVAAIVAQKGRSIATVVTSMGDQSNTSMDVQLLEMPPTMKAVQN